MKKSSTVLNLYTDTKTPGAFSGLSGFKINNKNLRNVDNILLKQEYYTKHILPNNNYKRRKVLVGGIDSIWQADLIDMQKFKYVNSHFNYILCVIDVFSKFAWARAIKKKGADDCYKAFKDIIESSGRIPKKIHIDGGNEFKGECRRYLHSLKIKTFISQSKLKAMIIERFNRTIKANIWRKFSFEKNNKYLKSLQDHVLNYNNRIHRSINDKPSNINKCNENQTFEKLSGFKRHEGGSNEPVFVKYSIGDYVRIALDKKIFEKKYTPNWTEEIHLISKVILSNPPMYKVKTLFNEEVTKAYYHQQLVKVFLNIDSFEVLESKKNKILIKHLNNEEESQPRWVNKKEFLDE